MQRRPQLAVAGVHAGAGIQQALHHLHKVIDAALRESAQKQEHSESCVVVVALKQEYTGRQTTTYMTFACRGPALLGKQQFSRREGSVS